MKINADLSKRAAVGSADLPWVPSPLPGVERRMLERNGEEVARVTSVVKYAPGSHFSEHTHGGENSGGDVRERRTAFGGWPPLAGTGDTHDA